MPERMQADCQCGIRTESHTTALLSARYRSPNGEENPRLPALRWPGSTIVVVFGQGRRSSQNSPAFSGLQTGDWRASSITMVKGHGQYLGWGRTSLAVVVGCGQRRTHEVSKNLGRVSVTRSPDDLLHSPSLSSIPILDRRYRSAFRESPSRRAACDLLPPARFKASRIISSSH